MNYRIRAFLNQSVLVLSAVFNTAIALHAQTTVTDDHGNNPSAATLVTLPSTVNGNLETAGDVDYFKFTLTQPMQVTATSAGTTDVVGTLMLGVTSTAGTEIYSDNDGAGAPNFRLTQLLPAGTHFVSVRPLVYGTTGAYSVSFAVSAPAATQPDITVSADGVETTSTTVVDLGTAAPGVLVTKDLVIGNAGDADLSVRSWRLMAGTMPSGAAFPFRVVSFAAATVQPGRQTTMRIGFQASIAADYTGTVSIVSNDGDEIFYNVRIKAKADGNLPTPEIAVRAGTVDVPNNGTITLGNTGLGVRLTKDITIANTGAADLKITSYSLVTTSPTGSSAITFYNGTPPATIAAGAAATVKVSLYSLTAGNFTGKLFLASNDSDEASTYINFTGSVVQDAAQGEIDLAVDGAAVANNGTVAFGNNVTGVGVSKNVVISNTGTADLRLTSWSLSLPPPVTVSVATTTLLGSPIATVADSSKLAVGMGIAGPFAAGTSIAAISGSTVTFSSPATSTLAGVSLAYFVAGPNATVNAFRVDSAVPTTIAAGASATVKLTYLPLITGNHTATFTLYNNDLDENPTKVTLTGHADANTNPPDIALALGTANVAMNSNIDFGSVPATTAVTKTFTIQNTGGSELRILTWQMQSLLPTGTTASSFYFSGLPSSIIPAGGSANLTIGFRPAAASVSYKSQIILSSTDPDESPYSFTVSGSGAVYAPPAPEIGFTQNGTNVPASGSVSYGSTVTGSPVTKAFIVANTGTATLTLSGWSFIYPSGNTVYPFRFEGALPTTVAAGATAIVNVTYAPTSTGDHTVTMQVGNNDADENPYRITLSGHADINPISPDISVFLGTAEVAQGATVDFGSTPRGVPVNKDFTIKNTGNSTLNLSGYSWQVLTPTPAPSVAAFSIGFTPGSTLAPGASGTLRLSFKPNDLSSSYSTNVKILCNDPDESAYTFKLTGSSLSTEAEIGVTYNGADLPLNGTIDFGSTVPVGTQVTRTYTITNTGAATLAITGWSIAPPAGTPFPTGPLPFVYSGLVSSVAPGASANVSVLFNPLSAGTFNYVLTMTNSDFDEGIYKINVTGTAVPSTTPPEVGIAVNGTEIASGGTLAYGNAGVNVSVTRDLVISNTGTGDLRVGSYSTLTTSPTGVVAFTTTQPPASVIPAGGTSTWRVAFKPLAVGVAYTGRLTLYNSDSDEGAYVINLTGTGDTSAPEIAIASGTTDLPNNGALAYGSTTTGSVISKTFTISNTGSAPLSLTGTSFQIPATTTGYGPGGLAFRFVGALPASVAAGATANLTVEYAPAAAGDHAAILQILNNDADEGTYKIALSAHADASSSSADIAVYNGTVEITQGSTLDFGTAPRNMTTYKPFTVKNTGSSTLTISGFSFTTLTPVPVPSVSPFTLSSASTSIAPGGSGTVYIAFKPTALSTSYSSTIKINSNDPDESPYTFTLTGTSAATDGEIGITLNSADVPNNSAIDFGSVVVGNQVSKTIVVTNSGTVTLGFNSWLVNTATGTTAPAGPLPFVYGNSISSLLPGQSINVPLNFTPMSAGTYSYVFTINNSDSDEGVYKINVTGTAVASTTPSDIAVSYNGTDVPSGGSVSFGAVAINTTVTREFVITNTGVDTLRIGAGYNIPVSPTNAAAILISQSAPATIAPGATGVWRFTFKPVTAGATYTNKLTLYNTDPDEGVFVINATGSTAP